MKIWITYWALILQWEIGVMILIICYKGDVKSFQEYHRIIKINHIKMKNHGVTNKIPYTHLIWMMKIWFNAGVNIRKVFGTMQHILWPNIMILLDFPALTDSFMYYLELNLDHNIISIYTIE